MTASSLNKRIIIEKETTAKNALGTPTETYSTLKETAANVIVRSGTTEFGSEGALPFTRVEFLIRYDSRVNYKCRILYESQYYSIDHIEMIGRKHLQKIRCIVWEGETSNG